MRKFINEVSYSGLLKLLGLREWILTKLKTKTFAFILGAIYATVSIILFYEGRELKNYIQGGLQYVETSEVSRIQGEVVSTATHQTLEGTTELSVEELITKYFGSQSTKMIEIARCESHLMADTVGDTHITFNQDGNTYGMSCGIFQIRTLPGRPTCDEMLNPEANIKMAKQIYDKQGIGAWRNCAIKLGYLN